MRNLIPSNQIVSSDGCNKCTRFRDSWNGKSNSRRFSRAERTYVLNKYGIYSLKRRHEILRTFFTCTPGGPPEEGREETKRSDKSSEEAALRKAERKEARKKKRKEARKKKRKEARKKKRIAFA